ncbi:MAG: FG-GAP repeat domain-containing protein, partial [bacterium]
LTKADFYHSGSYEIAVLTNTPNEIYILKQGNDKAFAVFDTVRTQQMPSALRVFDWDLDGLPDLAAFHKFLRTMVIYRNTGDRFVEVLQQRFSVIAQDLHILDFNMDGRSDIVLLDAYNRKLGIMISQNDGTFLESGKYETARSPSALASADLNSDGFPDIVITHKATNDVHVYLNIAGASLQPESAYGVGKAPLSITASDFNNDFETDIVVSNSRSANFTVLRNARRATLRFAEAVNLPHIPAHIKAIDNATIAIAYKNSDSISIFRLQDDKLQVVRNDTLRRDDFYKIQEQSRLTKQTRNMRMFTRDSQFVCLAVSYLAGEMLLWSEKHNRLQYFSKEYTTLPGQPAWSIVLPRKPAGVEFTDFDNDGNNDIALLDSTGKTLSLFHGLANGRFSFAEIYSAGNSPIKMVTVKDDFASLPDILLIDEKDMQIRRLRNAVKQLTTSSVFRRDLE